MVVMKKALLVVSVLIICAVMGMGWVIYDKRPLHPLLAVMFTLIPDQTKDDQSKFGRFLEDPAKLAGLRAYAEKFCGFARMPFDYSGSIENRVINNGSVSLPIRIYCPASDKSGLPLLVYYFGGGWHLGSIDAVDNIAKYLSQRGEAVVITVGYRLAPEDPYPAAVEDAYRAVTWAYENAPSFNASPDKIAVAGDSAGGMAAVMTLMSRDKQGPLIAYQALIYAVTDLTALHDVRPRPCYTIDPESVNYLIPSYVGKHDRRHPYISPLLAENLQGLPKARIITAGFDVLRGEGMRYANRLKEAGVLTEHDDYDNMVHGFITLIGIVKEARLALDTIAADLKTL
jgi:acetyl esterase